jgi:hypothetical protein
MVERRCRRRVNMKKLRHNRKKIKKQTSKRGKYRV